MTLKMTVPVLPHSFLLLFLGLLSVNIHALLDDIRCLKDIKASLEDPYGYLSSSWDFNNRTEGFICRFTGVDCWHPDENKVLNLRLANMGLKGTFPRGLRYCTSLANLDLSNNQLYGTIPSDVSTWVPFMTSLDLSSNNFSGEIPGSLANCTNLSVLKLGHNRLTGHLPKELELLQRLRLFDVSNNLLTGPVLNFTPANLINASYANNPQLCGAPLEACHHKHVMNLDYFKIGFIISYVASAATVFIYFSFSWPKFKNVMKIMLLYRLQNRFRRKEEARELIHRPTLNHQIEIPGLETLVNRISLEELCRATNNFRADNVVGMGKTGTMYKATFSNGSSLAVKKLHHSPQFRSRFLSELLALSRLKHQNIVPLLGFCTKRNQKVLVYKYMSNGNLYDWLNQPVQGEPKILEWPLRLKIAIGTARGISWLHHNCNFRVVHGDISSKSILLDHNFEPKISNFGKTIISNHGAIMVKYANDDDSGVLVNNGVWESDFVKEDVFKFGIVLLELLAWKEAINSCSSTSSLLHNNLVERINRVSASPGVLDEAIDKSLSGQGYDDEIMEVLRIATECVQPFPNERPAMLQVHKRISSLGERYGIITSYDSEYCSNQDITANTRDEILPAENP